MAVVEPEREPDQPAPHDGTVAVVLAAGGGSRFNGPSHKLLATLPAIASRPEEAVVRRSVSIALSAAIGPVVIVSGAVAPDVLAPLLDDVSSSITSAAATAPTDPPSIEFVHNERWSDGQMTSVRLGIAAARNRGARRVVIGLGDQPGITVEAWRAVAAEAGSIVVATYDGRRGNPVALQSDIWNQLPVDGDEGARSLMRLRPELVVEVPCSGSPDDIDTTEDLRRWQNNSSTNSP